MKPTPIKRILAVLAVLLLLVLAMATLAQAAPIRVVDDRGRTVTLPGAPQRIVSLLPSLTETVCALDACQPLVGVDRYSNWPAQVVQLPVVGGGLDPNIEAIVALRPDVVLMATSSRAQARLESLGVKVVALEPKTYADVQRVLATVGQALGVADAQRVWRVIDAGVQAASDSAAASRDRVRAGRMDRTRGRVPGRVYLPMVTAQAADHSPSRARILAIPALARSALRAASATGSAPSRCSSAAGSSSRKRLGTLLCQLA